MSNKKSTKNSNDNEKTKRVKVVKEKDINKKNKDKKKKGKHPKLMLALKILLGLFVIGVIIVAGIFAGVIFGLFGNDFDINELTIENRNSVVVDQNGNTIVTLNGEENREVISLQEMGEWIPVAFVSIEDERFYSHNGVDIIRTAGATIQYILRGGKSSYGGSTITQQLIKNATKENERDWTRKVKEIVRAYQVERVMSKDQILESYLNIIPLGGGGKNIHGVQVASKYYFDKKPAELSIAEAAYLAGINNAPNTYNPFKENPNTEKINERTKIVINKMKELGKLTDEQYNQAIAEVDAGLNFKEGTVSSGTNFDWHTESAINQIIEQMVEEKGLDKDTAKARLYGGGYTIYTTQDTSIQNIVQEEFNKTTYIAKGRQKDENGNLKHEQTQAGMVIIDQYTGYVVACAGGLGEKTVAFGTNRATEGVIAQPGSAIKPLATIAPGLQEGIITAASVFDDTPKSYGSYTPHNSYSGYKGLLNIRQMITLSANLPEVKLLQKLTPKTSIEYMTRMGLDMENQTEALSLVLGGTDRMQSPLDMAAAYAMIANGGEYIEPTFYTKVVDSNNNVIVEANQRRERILSEQNAYILQTILKGPVEGSGGTAGSAKISGMDVGAKTGSTNDYADRWLCGFTPYYTAATVFGYDGTDEGIHYTGKVSGNVALKIWSPIMKAVHKDLESKSFTKPSGIVTATVCKDSGLLANELCSQDQRGSRAYSEIFVKGTVPTKTCSTHVKLKICKDTGKIATEYCTNVEEKVFITRPNSDTDTSWKSAADAQYMAPTENCDKHTKPADTEKPVVTLNGEANITVKLNEKYTDKGAKATDNVDGDLTSKIKVEVKKDGKVVSRVDTSKEGTYIITYSVTDTAGNVGTKTRTIKVVKSTSSNNNDDDDNNSNSNTINNGNTNTGGSGNSNNNKNNVSTKPTSRTTNNSNNKNSNNKQ